MTPRALALSHHLSGIVGYVYDTVLPNRVLPIRFISSLACWVTVQNQIASSVLEKIVLLSIL